MNKNKYLYLIGALSVAGISANAGSAQAQQYPTRPIRIIAPYVPGGGVDFVSRVIATKLSETIGQQVIVENRPGGGTNIGSELVARAAPDGYTVLVGGLPNVVNTFLFKKLPYDLIKDFAPVVHTTTAPNILAVHPSLPVRSAKDLIALAKARKGELTFGSAGVGSSNHLSGELFRVMGGVDIVHVPYKGGGAAVTDLIAGQITMYFGTTPSTLPHVRSGRLRGLGVTTLQRARIAPDLPSLHEAALPGFDNAAWHALFVPVATPPAVVNKLAGEVMKVLRLPDTIERMAAQGVDVIAGSPTELAAYVKQEFARYEKLVKSAGLKAE